MRSTSLLAAFVATSITLVSGSTKLPISHDPVTGLWDVDGNPLKPISFLNNRWLSASNEELEFRKRSTPKCKPRSTSNNNQHHNNNNNYSLLGNLENLGGELQHFIKNGWRHDPDFGIVLAKAENEYADNEFLVDVQFGTPRRGRKPQTLKMVFDSGSPDTWVYGPLCCYAQNHTFFDPAKSTTFRNRTVTPTGQPIPAPPGTPGQSFNAMYGSSRSTQGYVGLDSFTLQDGEYTIPDLPLAIATNMTGSRIQRSMEGLIGLSPGNVSDVKGGWTTPFEALTKRGQLDQNYLSATLVKADRKTGKGGGGQYVFGEVDDSKRASEVVWTKVLSAFYWAAYYDSITIGDKTIAAKPATDERPIRYIIDTGTAYISMPPNLAKEVNAAIQGSYYSDNKSLSLPYLVPCDTGLPDYENKLGDKRNKPLIITIEGTPFSVPLSDLAFFPHLPIPPSLIGGRKNMCYSAIQPGPEGISVFGLSFIKNHLLVFDQGNRNLENRRIGFARRSDVHYDDDN